MNRLAGLTLEQMQELGDRLRKVGARSFETDLSRHILDEVEYCIDVRKAHSVTAIAESLTWPHHIFNGIDIRYKARLVRIALAVLGAHYDRTNYRFQWDADLTIDAK